MEHKKIYFYFILSSFYNKNIQNIQNNFKRLKLIICVIKINEKKIFFFNKILYIQRNYNGLNYK